MTGEGPERTGTGRRTAVRMKKRKQAKKKKQKLHHQSLLQTLLITLALDGAVSYLFFDSWIAFVILLPLWFPVRHVLCRQQERARLSMIQAQFLSGMQLVLTALQAGYAVENAFREAYRELRGMYEDGSFIVTEFRTILNGLNLNRTAEELLTELGARSRAEDIISFAEVFVCARRTGGDLIRIVRNTIAGILKKQETQKEIDTVLSGKIMEQRMMSVIPLMILFYIRLTSPDFILPLYHTPAGIIIMSISLAVYAGAFLWGNRIIEIRV